MPSDQRRAHSESSHIERPGKGPKQARGAIAMRVTVTETVTTHIGAAIPPKGTQKRGLAGIYHWHRRCNVCTCKEKHLRYQELGSYDEIRNALSSPKPLWRSFPWL